jgi:hypothetical protein
MGGISDEHVEWAIISRLKAMLDNPPKTKFNVTQSFALFSAIVLWSKNRAWVAGNAGARRDWDSPVDHHAHSVREGLRLQKIMEDPWLLSREEPSSATSRGDEGPAFDGERVNADFEEMTVEEFTNWLRNALAHGDGRTIRPLHRVSQRSRKTLLIGVRIESKQNLRSSRILTLSLYHSDIIRVGGLLADLFCRSLSGGSHYFEREGGDAAVAEAG